MSAKMGHLFGTIFEGILWGIYLILFLAALFLFRPRKGRQNRSQRTMCAAMLWLFCAGTAHFAVNLRYSQQGFSDHNGPDSYFNNTAHPLYVVDRSLEGVAMIIGNGLLIYRIWDMIPHGHWIVAFLTTLLLGSAAALFYITGRFSQLNPENDASVYAIAIKSALPAVFSLTLALNVFISLLILLRIQQAERLASTRDGMHRLTFLRRMIITAFESAILLPAFLLALIILYYAKSDNMEVVLIPIIQVMGIIPTVVWIQTRLGLTRYDAAIEHYAFTVSRDMQFATPDRHPSRPSHRPLECLFSHTDTTEDSRTKDELNSPAGSSDSFSMGTPKPPQCIPRGQPWQSPSVEQIRGPERREHPSSYR